MTSARLAVKTATNLLRCYARVFAILLGVIILSYVNKPYAQIDPIRFALQQTAFSELRWDNITAAPYWIDGKKPHYQPSSGIHAIPFAENDHVTVRLPAYQYLRLHSPNRNIQTKDWQVNLSNGTGIWLAINLQSTNDATSFIVSQYHTQERLIRLRYIGKHNTKPAIALFVSRRIPAEAIAPYRDAIALGSQPYQLRRAHEAAGLNYWRLDPATPATVTLIGPARVALQHRSYYLNINNDNSNNEDRHDDNPSAVNDSNNLKPQHEYHLHLTLNEKPFKHIPVLTSIEKQNAFYVNGTVRTLSRLTQHYVEIPDGTHTLHIRTTQPILARLSKQPVDYLFPSLNTPATTAADIRDQLLAQPDVPLRWPLSPRPVNTPLSARITQIEHYATTLVNDNAYRDSRLNAAQLMQLAANKTYNDPQITNTAKRLSGAYTFFRHLFPEKPTPPALPSDISNLSTSLRYRFFHSPRLLPVNDEGQGITISAQYARTAMRQTSRAYFTPLTNEDKNPQLYPIPQRETASTLRLIVNRSNVKTGTTLFMQYDDEAVISLIMEAEHPLPPKHYAPDLSHAALTLLTASPKRPITLTDNISDARLGRITTAIPPAISAATLELSLPPRVRNIKLWQASGTPLQVALQYRSSKPNNMEEINYKHHLADVTEKNGFNTAQLKQLLHITPIRDMPALLVNDWLPIAQRLRSQQKLFSHPIPPVQSPLITHDLLSSANWKKHRKRAFQAERSQQWLTALEQWSIIAHGTQYDQQREAQTARIAALQQLGETYQANRMLKGWFLYADDPQLSHIAKQLLIASYTRAGNTTALMGLWASALLHHPTVDNLQPYIKLLVEQNQYQHALLLALALPPTQRPNELVALCAFKLGWWHIFNDTLMILPPESQQLWLGYRAFHQEKYTLALRHWQRAGKKGELLTDYLQHGINVIEPLHRAKNSLQEDTFHQWSQWLHQHPGPNSWQTAPEIVKDHQGMSYLYAIEQHKLAPAFRASKKRPVKIAVWGPITLRFQARILHNSNNPNPVDDWLVVRSKQQTTVLPINNNRPSPGLTLVASDRLAPGTQQEIQHTLDAGYHELSISAEHHDLLLQVSALRPQLPLLSPLSLQPQDIATIFTTIVNQQPNLTDTYLSCNSLTTDKMLYRCQQTKTSTQSRPLRPITIERAITQTHYSPITPQDLGITTKAQTLNHSPKMGIVILEQLTSETLSKTISKMTSKTPETLNENETRELITNILWHGEQTPALLAQWLPIAEHLFQQHANAPGLKSIYTRLSKGLNWKLLESVPQSAGLYYADHQGWNPESPSLRIRKALLGINDPNTHIITGRTQHGLGMTNLTPTKISLQLHLLDLPFTTSVTTNVRVRLNKKTIKEITLSDKNPVANLSLPIPAGNHALRISLVNPVINQFLKITLHEKSSHNKTTLTRSVKRAYHVATHAEPIHLHVLGPARLRIDEWSSQQVDSRYQTLGAGWHNIALTPDARLDHTYFRIYQRTKANDTVPPRPRPLTPVPIEPKPGPLSAVRTVRQTHGPYTVVDNLPLGGQEDGTWSWAADLVSRRQIDEDRTNNDNAEEFLQLNATHRYFSEHQKRYTKNRFLARLRDTGGPTLGFQSGAHYQPRWKTWRATLQADLYAQNPEKTINNAANKLEWSAVLRGSLSQHRRISAKSFHLPKVSLFQRKLSLRNFKHYAPTAVDQDIFSRYKQDHPRGIIIGDNYVYQPWLDTEWNLAGNITSNKSLNPLKPDHIDIRMTWKQLLRLWKIKAQYGHRYYFDDSHRTNALSRNRLTVDIGIIRWQSMQRRWQFNLQYRYDLEPNDNSLVFTLAWHGGYGRAFRDFGPGEIDFKQLQYRRASTLSNNYIYGHHADE